MRYLLINPYSLGSVATGGLLGAFLGHPVAGALVGGTTYLGVMVVGLVLGLRT